MGIKAELKALVDELDRTHLGASSWSAEDGFPEFVTTEVGTQRRFTQKARETLWKFSKTLYENRSPDTLRIELEHYGKIVRQAVADIHAAGYFSSSDESDHKDILHEIKLLVETRIEKTSVEYIHYFAAWTLGMEVKSPFRLGPVKFLNRADWIDSVDFPQQAKDNHLSAAEANHRWKDILKEALQRPRDGSPIEGLAGAVLDAVIDCPALIKVTIRGYDLNLSRKLGRLAAKTALDAISLGFGAPECFHQQALQDERLPPISSNSLVESDGFLWLPGMSLGKRVPSFPLQRVEQGLVDMTLILPAFAAVLEGLVNPSTHAHPKLANRWATALDWFGEGVRETSDAIALAKLGTCLDVLSCGGKFAGIRDMVSHLTGVSKITQVVKGIRPLTLEQLVKDIYDHGRSKILHGTYYNRLESFAVQRQQAAFLARAALIESALRLQNFGGLDDEKAFRTI